MANPGIIVSERGDVTHADIDEMSYTSKAQSPKVSKPYRGSFTTNAKGFGTVTIPHDITYSPAYFAFYKVNDGDWLTFNNTSIGLDTDTRSFTILTYDYGGDTPPPSVANAKFDYKVWLLLDPAQDIL